MSGPGSPEVEDTTMHEPLGHEYDSDDDPMWEEDSHMDDRHARDALNRFNNEPLDAQVETADRNDMGQMPPSMSLLRRNEADEEDDDDLRNLFTSDEDDDDSEDEELYQAIIDPEIAELKKGIKSKRPPKKPKGSRGGSAASRLKSDEVRTLISEATTLYGLQKYDDALKMLEVAIAKEPSKEAYELTALIHYERGNMVAYRVALLAVVSLDQRSKRTWAELGEASDQQGLYEEAFKFFMRAYRLDKKDKDILGKCIELCGKTNRYEKAVELLRILRKLQPTNSQVLMELADYLQSLDRTGEAILLYEDLLESNKDPYVNRDKVQEFGFSELNILVELYFSERNWSRAIKRIRTISRWILDRSDEAWWDEMKDDSEFDDRRYSVKKFLNSPHRNHPERFTLPVDIRVKLIIARLKTGDVAEAQRHTEFLKEYSVVDYGDLYWIVGQAFQEAKQFETALELYREYEKLSDQFDVELSLQIARCQFATNRISEAEETYEVIRHHDAENVEAIVALAEVLGSTNRSTEARLLIDQANEIREQNKVREAQMADVETENDSQMHQLIIQAPRRKTGTARRTQRLTKAERVAAEKAAEQFVTEKYAQLQRYHDGMLKGNPASVSEWLHIADQLVDMFNSVKKFFPSDRNKPFVGIFTSRTSKVDGDLDERINRLETRLEESELADEAAGANGSTEESSETNRPPESFRGLSFDQWFSLIMQYALTLTTTGDIDGAYQVLKRARAANVFYQDPEREDIMHRVMFSCTFRANDVKASNEAFRTYFYSHQFYNDAFRLYGYLLSSGSEAGELYNSTQNQKFILRQVKAIDSIVQKREITGAAKVVDQEMTNIETENPLLLALYGFLLLEGKSYVPSLEYLNRAYELAPKDPLLLLSVGLAHIHRALQRQTTNRHLQIVQGLTYLMQYYDIRCSSGPSEAMEANYNLGRTFHMLGLPSLAVHYYDKVLAAKDEVNDDYNYCWNAAYNLHLIYTIAGNPRLARKVIDEHIVI